MQKRPQPVVHTGHIKFLAKGQSADGELFLKLRISSEGKDRIEILSLGALERESNSALSALRACLVTAETRRELQQRVQRTVNHPATLFVATLSGWFGRCFVLPSGEVIGGGKIAVCLGDANRQVSAKFGHRGTLQGWQRVAELARGNSRFMLALALAFAGPVVELLALELPMIQLVGAAGSGKSGISVAAGSVWGGRLSAGRVSFAETWNQTVNNLEALAVGHSGTFLILDDTRLADQDSGRARGALFRSVSSAVMRLAEGTMKGRLTDSSPTAAWSLGLLSISNFSLDEMAAETGVVVDEALRSRLIDVPLPLGASGAFERLHGFADHAALTAKLKRLAALNFGCASREFLRRLVEWRTRDEGGLRSWLEARRETYRREAVRRIEPGTRDLARVHEKFATLFAAGALAIKFGILPWKRIELGRALLVCERAHVDLVAKQSPRRGQHADPWKRLVAYVAKNRSKFIDLRRGPVERPDDHDHASCAGYIHRRQDGRLELLFSEALLARVCGGLGVLRQLLSDAEHGRWILRDKSRFSVKRTIAKGVRRQVIAFDATAFEAIAPVGSSASRAGAAIRSEELGKAGVA